MILFNNKEILIGGKPKFIREWLNNNISTEIHLGKAKLRTSISYSTKDSHEVSNWSNKMESNHAAQWRNMEKIFTSLKNICKETKLKEFQFKLIHRIVVTKKELYQYGIKLDDECFDCGEHDSIDHTSLSSFSGIIY